MDLHTSTATHRPGPLAGFFSHVFQDANGTYQTRTAVAQTASATVNDNADFDGANDSGAMVNGAVIPVNNPANGTALAAALTAAGLSVLLGLTWTYVGTTLSVSNPGTVVADLTFAPYNPSSPELVFSAFTSVASVPAPAVGPGMGVVWKHGAARTFEAPKPDSGLEDFAGVCDRTSLMPDRTVQAAGVTKGYLLRGQPLHVVRRGGGTLAAAVGATITDGAPVYLGRITGESGYWYAEDDGGNTRLLIPGWRWAQNATGAGTAQGVQAILA